MLINYEAKVARFREEQERIRNKPMSKHIRRAVAKKLKESIVISTNPLEIAALANQLAKFLPRPKQAQRKRGAQTPIKETKEPSLDELVAEVEKKRKEARKSLEAS